MVHFIDTNSFRLLESYYPSRFPSFWQNFDRSVRAGDIASVREVRKEIEQGNAADHIEKWVKTNPHFFRDPDEDELHAVRDLFSNAHFQSMVGQKQILRGTPVADPFLIAAARVSGGCVVTEERAKPNSTKIPSVCSHLGVRCTNLEGMLVALKWRF